MWIFILFIGLLLSTFSQCERTELQFEFNGHKSALYLVDNQRQIEGGALNGIDYIFHKFSEQLAIHALLHYEYNLYAPNKTKEMLLKAIDSRIWKRGAETREPWTTFLEKELKNIEKELMKPSLSKSEALSRTSASIIIVDRDEVTQTRLGNSQILSFSKNFKPTETQSEVNKIVEEGLKSALGGKCFKKTCQGLNTNGMITTLSDVGFIVMATGYTWKDINAVSRVLAENEKNLAVAAREINSMDRISSFEKNKGVIVIGLNYLRRRKLHSSSEIEVVVD